MLALKVRVTIMLLRNIDQPNGLCNRTRLQVLKLTRTSISAQIINGTHFGKKVIIPRLRITSTDKRLPLKIVRKQFPLSVSLAMKINKSQGQSLSKVGLYLPRPVFTHGQLYVAVSRVKIKRGLKVVVCDQDDNQALEEFYEASGRKPNMSKSILFCSNVEDEILSIVPFNVGKLPVRYMGVPLVTRFYDEKGVGDSQLDEHGDPLDLLLFALVLHPVICKIRDSFSLSLHAWYLDNGIGDTLVVGKEDPRSRLARIFLPNIARPLHDVKLLGGPVSVDFDFWNEFVMKRVAKTIVLMDAIAKINDPQCELLLLCSCTGISRLYFTMCTCPPRVFESAQRSFDVALCSSLERSVTTSGPKFGDWQCMLVTLPFSFGGLGIYSAGDVLNYAFLASRLQSVNLQTKLIRHAGIVAFGPIFDDTLSMFNTSMETDLLCNPTETAAPKLMNKMADIYFTRPCSTCSRVFNEDIYGDHAISCAGIVGIKHRHNVVRDTLVDICYLSRISAGKEVDIRMADFLLDRAMIDVAQRKRGKYMAKCAAIGYGYLPFSFSFLGELEPDAVTLLKWIRKFSMAQDIGARTAVHIFNRISFTIAKEVGRI
ncbi:zinc finger, CCHC-type containing protein [Tanacetum coccineum]